MKVLVIGAGVVGVTTAYYLARYGHEVTVLEKESEVATLASAANAGLIAPGHSFAWASPTAPRELLRSLTVDDTALRVNPLKAPGMAAWGLRFLRECTAERARRNTLVKLRLARYSQRKLDEIAEAEKIDYLDVHEGVLYLYRNRSRFEAGIRRMELVREHGKEQHVLDPDGIAEVEPALGAVKEKLAGGIYAVTDSSGDSVRFSRELQKVSETMGARFLFGAGVRRLVAKDGRVQGVVTEQGDPLTADVYVLCAGVQSAQIAGTIGLRLPIAPAKGYSATFPVRDGGRRAPRIGGVDEELLVAWCRLGDRLRMTSSAEFTGYETSWRPRDFRGIMRMARELLPKAADYDMGSYRACNRPMTPDGPPILGTTRLANLYLNSGHGHMGFTMACGSSRIVADLIDGRTPEIPTEGMTLTSRPSSG